MSLVSASHARISEAGISVTSVYNNASERIPLERFVPRVAPVTPVSADERLLRRPALVPVIAVGDGGGATS